MVDPCRSTVSWRRGAQAAEDADAAEATARAADPERAARWQRHARIIAAMLEPVARPGDYPDASTGSSE
jgi:hypothetical protein